MTRHRKQIEEHLFYRFTSRAYEFLMLNMIYFILTFFFFIGINNTLWSIEAWLLFIPFLMLNSLYLSGVIRYFQEKEMLGYGVSPIQFLRCVKKQLIRGFRIGLIASVVYTIIMIDVIFILLHPSLYFLFAILGLMTLMITIWLIYLITIDVYQCELTFKEQAKLTLLMSLKRWYYGLANLFWLVVLVVCMVYQVQIGFLLLPSLIYFIVYKINDLAYQQVMIEINEGETL